MPYWNRNKHGAWRYYDEQRQEITGYNPLGASISKGFKAAKNFIEWSDPKLAEFENTVVNVLGEGWEEFNRARVSLREKKKAISDPIMNAIGDRSVWHEDSLKDYGEPLTIHQYNKRKDDEFLQEWQSISREHRSSKFRRQHQATTDFFTKQNTEVE